VFDLLLIAKEHFNTFRWLDKDSGFVIIDLARSGKDRIMEQRHIDRPAEVVVEEAGDRLRISWPTLGPRWKGRFLALTVAPLCILFLSWSVYQIGRFFWGAADFGACITSVFLMIPILVALYFGSVGAFNTSVIQVDRDVLTAQSGPIPYARTRAVLTADVRQVYVALEPMRINRVRFNYWLCALTKDGRSERLVQVDEGEIPLFLEQKIECFLDLEDEVVRGEWRPDPYLWEK
jgi:hypothetical protein